MEHPASLTTEEIQHIPRIGPTPSSRDVADAQLRKAIAWTQRWLDDLKAEEELGGNT